MDLALLIQHKLTELRLEQRSLADAAEVTESYISQLLSRKKLPPAPDRTDIYEKLERLLKLPDATLANLAELQRRQEIKRKIEEVAPAPLLSELREMVISKCKGSRRRQIRSIFEKEPFGELERIVTQTLVEAAKSLVREELKKEQWLRLVGKSSGRSYKQMRVRALEFLDSDVFNISHDSCMSFLDPLVESWDIDLASFALEIILNHKIARDPVRRYEFAEKESARVTEQPGLQEFLKNRALSGTATPDEIDFLKQLRFKPGHHPTALYYYRELQNLRDPLHFRSEA